MKFFILLALVAVAAGKPVGPLGGALVSRTIASDQHVVHPHMGLAHGMQGLGGIGGLGGYYGGLVGYPGAVGVHQTIQQHSIAHVPHVGLGGLYKGYYGGYFPGSFGIGYGQFGGFFH